MVPSERVTPVFVQLAAHPLRWQLLTALAGGDYRVRELTGLVEQPQNLVSYHLRLLRRSGLVAARRSSFDGRDSYYHLDLDGCADALAATGAALHPALDAGPRTAPDSAAASPSAATGPDTSPGTGPGPGTGHRPRVLFTCTGNSARSPIAEALLRERTAGHVDVISAGSAPRPAMHPDAVRVLREHYGIDIAGRHPRHLETVSDRRFDYVISLCDKVREVCPEFPGRPRRVHWSIPDPAQAGGPGQGGYPAFHRTATEIDNRIPYLLARLSSIPHQEVHP